jgi:molybdopterin biosynthesis enzyme
MPVPVRQRVNAVLTTDIKKASAFDMITRVELKRTGEGFTATPLSRSTSMPEILRQGKGLLTVPIECNGYSKGDIVQVELLTGIEQI